MLILIHEQFYQLSSLILASFLFLAATGCSIKNGSTTVIKEDPKKIEETNQNKTNAPPKTDENNTSTPTPTPTPVPTPQQQPINSNIVYVKASTLNIREQPINTSKKIDDVIKGTALQILEKKTDEQNKVWLHIGYKHQKVDVSGWVQEEFTVLDRTKLLSAALQQLDYSPQPKTMGYPGNPKQKVRGIYLTIYSTGGQRLDKLIEMAKRTGINAFVIDVKDDKGSMLFPTKAAEKYAPDANRTTTVKNITALMKTLKDNHIYSIARIVSFKDPIYTKLHPDRVIVNRQTGQTFTDSAQLAWATAYDRQLWEYNIAVSKEAAAAGFNEIQFDYVRFPASNGGKMDKILDYRNTNNESKPQAIQEYLKFAHKELSPLNVYISADIYGLVGSVTDDMALGQYWEAISNVVDYICPMMYPSHYANGTYSLSIPDIFPYETVYNSAKQSLERNSNIPTPSTIRPWLQDFTASWVPGHIPYGEKEVRAQIKALQENGIDEFLLWNAGNTYTESALTK